jgi:hypothetical protein
MSRIGEWRKTERVELVLAETLCDLCGRPVTHDQDPVWGMNNVTIRACVGEHYPETDMRDVTACDVCATCFAAKVVPALEGLGVKWRRHPAEPYQYEDTFDAVRGSRDEVKP